MLCHLFEKVLQLLFKLQTIMIRSPARSMLITSMWAVVAWLGPLPQVVALVLRYRPDILFLGNLVTSRDHIGRLKKTD